MKPSEVLKSIKELRETWRKQSFSYSVEQKSQYDKLVALHGKNSKNPLKVQDIGGLECSKCHY